MSKGATPRQKSGWMEPQLYQQKTANAQSATSQGVISMSINTLSKAVNGTFGIERVETVLTRDVKPPDNSRSSLNGQVKYSDHNVSYTALVFCQANPM
jgi:hypothetical protein